MNALCLVVDRLHRGFLGPYGNTWLETPTLNRLAATGFTFDQALVNSTDLAEFYRGVWRGHLPGAADESALRDADLPSALHRRGVSTALVSDDPAAADLPWAAFDEVLRLPAAQASAAAEEIAATAMAAALGQAAAWWNETNQPRLLWVHLGSLARAFDAPLELRNALVDEDEPLPSQETSVPRLILPPDFDPDELLGWRRCYAGQIQAFDALLGGLLEAVGQRADTERTLVAVVSPRGFSLGEHGRVGPWDAPLHSELVHVPWWLQLPAREDGAAQGRSQALVQPGDLYATLLSWFGAGAPPDLADVYDLAPLVREDAAWPRDRIAVQGESGEWGLRTAHWYLRQTAQAESAGGDAAAELFVKPDDAWEQNEVAARCGASVELLTAALAQFQQSPGKALSAPLAPLAESAHVQGP